MTGNRKVKMGIENTSAGVDPATEVPAAEGTAPEVQPVETPEEKKFTQAELDAIVAKRLARERRTLEREQQTRAADAARVSVPVEIPPIDHFASPDAYAEALAEQKAVELVNKRESAMRQAETMEAYHNKEEEARTRYDDFEQVAYNPQLRITDTMADVIRDSDIGPELAYHLGMNPKEAERIANLSPLAQAKEIGKIEVKLTETPPTKKTTSAPEPIKPVKAGGGSGVVDTTDPRSVQNMTTSEWIAAERQRQINKAKAQNR